MSEPRVPAALAAQGARYLIRRRANYCRDGGELVNVQRALVYLRACEHGHYDIVSSIGDMMAPSMSRLFLTLFVGASYAAWIALRGPITGVDTGSYERWADALIAAHFHYVDYYTQQQFMIRCRSIAAGSRWWPCRR